MLKRVLSDNVFERGVGFFALGCGLVAAATEKARSAPRCPFLEPAGHRWDSGPRLSRARAGGEEREKQRPEKKKKNRQSE